LFVKRLIWLHLIVQIETDAKSYFFDRKTNTVFSFQEEKRISPFSKLIIRPSYFSWIKHTWEIWSNNRIFYMTSSVTDMGMSSILMKIILSLRRSLTKMKWNTHIFFSILSRKENYFRLFFDLYRKIIRSFVLSNRRTALFWRLHFFLILLLFILSFLPINSFSHWLSKLFIFKLHFYQRIFVLWLIDFHLLVLSIYSYFIIWSKFSWTYPHNFPCK